MKFQNKLYYILIAARPNQWVKNFVIYTSIVFSGQLFEKDIFIATTVGFVIFCLLSSTSYILNDIIDYPYDKKHPAKRNRPIAAGRLTIPDATFVVFLLTLFTLTISLFFSTPFFLIAFVFLLLHFFYSLYFKTKPVLDIFAISFSFMLRAFAGQVISGYHIQIWLLLTIFFISLFLAAVKRHAELVAHGTDTRFSLYSYREHFLNFLTSTFATLTITTYSLYTFLERPPLIESPVSETFSQTLAFILPNFEARKWFMITIPLVVYGIARYALLLYTKDQGETPEKIITQDKPLMVTVGLWGIIVVGLIYLF
ncbi:MAG: UbiA prenyltransferase family protein [Candidatus Paceibacterota bacterium]